eukprot:Unigene356_Nuclearia_a/m.1230 Unigene356_Nuclearia_a/g.1230  ORF Unigene356_Nuclearia_a/g.1230 Unigene356_Nuclearia_a/m.1230 type:complete len:1228 (+) Unigene356_Nuclearia_a:36-3719(+)
MRATSAGASPASPASDGVDGPRGVDAEAALRTTTRNLQVLRERFAKLNEEHMQLKQAHERLQRRLGDADSADGAEVYVTEIVSTVHALFASPRFSDVAVVVEGKRIPAHKFVLNARSKFFREADLDDVSEIAIADGVSAETFTVLLRFLYTDSIEMLNLNDRLAVQILSLADAHGLVALRKAMETVLIGMLDRANCTRLFVEANRLKAPELRQAALEIIVSEFDNITTADFDTLDASLMAEVYRAKSHHFLHLAVRQAREDVVFLFLLEPDVQARVDELDENGLSPLQVALRTRHESIASTLIERGANASLTLERHRSILMAAIEEGDSFAALFLLKHGADAEAAIEDSGLRPVHLATRTNQLPILAALLEAGADVNAQALGTSPDSDGTTALHLAVRLSYKDITDLLLSQPRINVNLRDRYNNSVLWNSLASGMYSAAAAVIAKGANCNERMADGSTLLHRAVRSLDVQAVRFLLSNRANVNDVNNAKESPLHAVCAIDGKQDVLVMLLEAGADVTLQNAEGQTPMHVALQRGPMSYAQVLLQHGQLPLDLVDNEGYNLLWLALERGERAFAGQLVQRGASLSIKTQDGYTHLGRAIVRSAPVQPTGSVEEDELAAAYCGDCEAIAQFYISARAPVVDVDPLGQSAVVLAILYGRVDILRSLCTADPQAAVTLAPGSFSNESVPPSVAAIPNVAAMITSPLNLALLMGAPTPVLDVLVKAGADVNHREPGTDCPLLMRRIVEGDMDAAALLVQAKCNVNMRSRVPTPWTRIWDVELPQVPTTPLHVAALLNQVAVVTALVDAGADLDAQDDAGETALHVAVATKRIGVVHALLRGAGHKPLNTALKNSRGQSVFALAYALRDVPLAQALAAHSNGFSTEVDERTGLTFLQRAIDLNDTDGAQFLMQLKVNALNPGRHPTRDSPMHMAASRGLVGLMELILKTDPSAHEIMNDAGRTPLHLAALYNHLVAADLLVRQPRCVAQDVEGETALHLAIAAQHWAVSHLLIERAPGMGKRVNTREELPLHVLARAAPTRGASADGKAKGARGAANGRATTPINASRSEGIIAILEMLCAAAEDIDVRDGEGNTALLKAYLHANEVVAVELMRRGALIMAKNSAGECIMDYIATEGTDDLAAARLRLQRQLLELIDKDMPWQDGPNCEICQAKFSFQKRKHHCRHCGRIGCSNCLPSTRQYPILKFGLQKPERLCAPCYDYLSVPLAQQSSQ